MTQIAIKYPALYNSANKASAVAQKKFWKIIQLEFFLLFLVAILSSTKGIFEINTSLITINLAILAGVFVYKIVKKLDQNWYRCRALAESVKTSTWRFSMRSHPFEDAQSIEVPKKEFRNLLLAILKANQSLAEELSDTKAQQFTDSMMSVRDLPLDYRLEFYINNRIDDQRKWYAQKSAENRDALRNWLIATITIYILAALALNADKFGIHWASFAFDPLIVIVTSAIGWLQMKRHSELTASYNLTAHEISIIREKSDTVNSEKELSNFVNEAELAFSREHTQWVARRDAT